MLTIKQVIKIYTEGYELKFKRKKHPHLKGEFNPQKLETTVYLPNIQSKSDLDITILHEFIHARNDLYSKKQCEPCTEKEAIETYEKRPHILMFIKDLYKKH